MNIHDDPYIAIAIPIKSIVFMIKENSTINENNIKIIIASAMEAALMRLIDDVWLVDSVESTTSWTKMNEYCSSESERTETVKTVFKASQYIEDFLITYKLIRNEKQYPTYKIKPGYIQLRKAL